MHGTDHVSTASVRVSELANCQLNWQMQSSKYQYRPVTSGNKYRRCIFCIMYNFYYEYNIKNCH